MKFKSFSRGNAPGLKITEPSQVVPDQSLTLQEILTRFTRREALPVGNPGVYGSEGSMDPESDHELNIDVEKMKYEDLTVKSEFGERVKEYVSQHDSRMKEKAEAEAKAKREAEEKEREKRIRIAAKKLANSKKPG